MIFSVFFIVAGIIQGIILGLSLLFAKRGNKRANRFLALLVLVLAVNMCNSVMVGLRIYDIYPNLLLVSFPPAFLLGPLFFLYERTLTLRTRNASSTRWIHFAPFAISIAVLIPFYAQPASVKLALWTDPTLYYEFLARVSILEGLQTIQTLSYVYVVNADLKRYQSMIAESYSAIDNINLRWLRFGVGLILGAYVFVIVLLAAPLVGYRDFVSSYGAQVTGILDSLCLYVIGYRGLIQPEIFGMPDDREPESPLSAKDPDRKSPEFIAEMNILHSFMKEQKPYLKEDLTLPELAQRVGIPRNHLSMIINNHTGENFFTFINRYRVEEVKSLMSDPRTQGFTILSLAYESGFPSKSSFHAIFKKYTGMTPSEFRNTNHQASIPAGSDQE